jgi:hypothetical protein
MKKELLDENSHIEVNIHRVVNTWYVLPCVGCHALDRYLPNAVWNMDIDCCNCRFFCLILSINPTELNQI